MSIKIRFLLFLKSKLGEGFILLGVSIISLVFFLAGLSLFISAKSEPLLVLNFSGSFMDSIETILNAISSVATIAAAVAAIYGIRSWRRKEIYKRRSDIFWGAIHQLHRIRILLVPIRKFDVKPGTIAGNQLYISTPLNISLKDEDWIEIENSINELELNLELSKEFGAEGLQILNSTITRINQIKQCLLNIRQVNLKETSEMDARDIYFKYSASIFDNLRDIKSDFVLSKWKI